MIIELLIMTFALACLMIFFDIATLFLALALIKRSLSTANVITWLNAKDPATGHSIMSAVISIAKHSFAGMIGGSTPKKASGGGGGLEQALVMLQALQGIGAAKKAAKPEEPKV